jgi:hypothetical protein
LTEQTTEDVRRNRRPLSPSELFVFENSDQREDSDLEKESEE